METRVAEYVMILLKSRITIVWSWGSSKFTPITNGLTWHVEGYLFNGWVKVLYNEGTDAFDIYFLNNRKEEVKKVEEVYLDSLIDVIDYHVEKNGSFDYDQRVKETYTIVK